MRRGSAPTVARAWGTPWSTNLTSAGARPGDTVLIQGAGGGVATALVVLGRRAGLRMWVTSRQEERGARAVELGADRAFAAGERLPERVDAGMETVGAATWSHSINALRPGGTLVISGTTSWAEPARAELTKIFFRPLRVIGSTMGTRDELVALVGMLVTTGARPVIDRVLPLDRVSDGLAALIDGGVFGKVVVEP